jgi:small subunit ribosomal protein S19
MADKPGAAPAAGEAKPKEAKEAKPKESREAPRPKERVRKSVLEKLQRMPRRKGEFSYRGYTLEQLQSMDLETLAEVLPSRVRRKLGRGLSPEERKFMEKVQGDGAALKTHLRRMVVLPAMVGKEIQVHNGKTFEKIAVMPEMIGHYLGELALTRKRVKHGAAGIGATRSSKFIPLK